MDTTDPDIYFDEQGVCNHCYRYDTLLADRTFSGEKAKTRLAEVVGLIKDSGKGKEYDCIIGVSGGVDSTYVAYLVKQLGLRPLAVHFDNGWNSELAVSNIEKVLKVLDIDLYTYVIDWEEFKQLQLSFLKASTPDGEVPTDHAISALLFEIAAKHDIKYIISGMNFATESMAVSAWAYGHSDWKYIKAVHKNFSNQTLKNYPHFSLAKLFYYTFIKKIKVAAILNYVEYNKQEAMDVLQQQLGWVYYGGKHYESVYTRFYQSYILPVKFNIDKRRGHLSDLIRSGQVTRDEALEEMSKPTADPKMIDEDRSFAIKKLELSDAAFESIMQAPKKNFTDYPNNYGLVSKVKKVINWMRRKNLYTK